MQRVEGKYFYAAEHVKFFDKAPPVVTQLGSFLSTPLDAVGVAWRRAFLMECDETGKVFLQKRGAFSKRIPEREVLA